MKYKYLAVRKPDNLKGVYSSENAIKSVQKQMNGIKGVSIRTFNEGEEQEALAWANVKDFADVPQVAVSSINNNRKKSQAYIDKSFENSFETMFLKYVNNKDFNFVVITTCNGDKIGFLSKKIVGGLSDDYVLDSIIRGYQHISYFKNILDSNSIICKYPSKYNISDCWIELENIVMLDNVKIEHDYNSNKNILSTGTNITQNILLNINNITSIYNENLYISQTNKHNRKFYIADCNEKILEVFEKYKNEQN